jgi:hypothetical protein
MEKFFASSWSSTLVPQKGNITMSTTATRIEPPISPNLVEGAREIVRAGFGRQKAGFPCIADESGTPFDLRSWDEAGVQFPHEVVRGDTYGSGSNRVQEVTLRFMYRVTTKLGFEAFPLVMMSLRRGLPPETEPKLEDILMGKPWTLFEIKYMPSSAKRSEIRILTW